MVKNTDFPSSGANAASLDAIISGCRKSEARDNAVEQEPVPAWLSGFESVSSQLLDVRPILLEGREPIADVLAAADRIPNGGGLVICAPFNPAPLRSVLHGRGFATYGSRLGEGHWSIRVVRTAAPPPMPRTTKRQPPARAVPGSAVKLGGATQRLLPELVPLRFFGVAVFAHAATWAGILLFAEALPGFHGGAGPALAILHVAVLGVLLASGPNLLN